MPRPTVAARLGASLEDHPLYARLASELGVPLHGGGWARVLGDERLRSDAILDQLHGTASVTIPAA